MSDSTFQPDNQPGQSGSGPTLPPAGWYPDPADSGSQRYWDGKDWTNESRRLQPAGWYADPAGSQLERYWDGNAWTEQTRPPAPAAPQAGPAARAAANPAAPGTQQAPTYGQQAPGGYGQPAAPYGQATGPQGQPVGAQGQPGTNPYGPQGYPAAGAPPYYRSQGGFTPYGVPQTADGVRLAGWWARFGSLIVDGIVLNIINSIVLWLLSSTISSGMERWWNDIMSAAASGNTSAVPLPTDPQYGHSFVILLTVSVVISFAYSVLLQKFFAATLGQMLFGLRVVPVDHGTGPYRLSWSTALIRNGVYALIQAASYVVGFLIVVNGLWPLFQRRRQTWHDMVARTQVVSIRP
ncbi:RDD family protein [Propionibacterium freudenreichii]|uniref:DUF2510 domain-containing protein n=1 Tax=Propionibacterium freudenreichii TaxID=1744 RepID=UPI0005422253|nr:DUF2510 domain-containing protein [Propionibacterium freudenreichii]MDK9644399.1 RDD family protein [Propionibacterium freudenreichii]CEG85325.1 Hypothetical protein PFCIRM118_07395 [Propionibacterium freudenreichii]CEI25193.1 Hypothetical protein PFCIRM508_03315 [Propionibacterium freudenreichii]